MMTWRHCQALERGLGQGGELGLGLGRGLAPRMALARGQQLLRRVAVAPTIATHSGSVVQVETHPMLMRMGLGPLVMQAVSTMPMLSTICCHRASTPHASSSGVAWKKAMALTVCESSTASHFATLPRVAR